MRGVTRRAKTVGLGERSSSTGPKAPTQPPSSNTGSHFKNRCFTWNIKMKNLFLTGMHVQSNHLPESVIQGIWDHYPHATLEIARPEKMVFHMLILSFFLLVILFVLSCMAEGITISVSFFLWCSC